jgi:hypothetical protein
MPHNDPREEKLPAWARALVTDLRNKVAAGAEPLKTELDRIRPKREELKRRNEALTELLECAALGRHKTAAQIMEILSAYSLKLVKEEVANASG